MFLDQIEADEVLAATSNLVTYFMKIPEMAMANLVIIPYSLVESQFSWANIGLTWSIWIRNYFYFDEPFCLCKNSWSDLFENEAQNLRPKYYIQQYLLYFDINLSKITAVIRIIKF